MGPGPPSQTGLHDVSVGNAARLDGGFASGLGAVHDEGESAERDLLPHFDRCVFAVVSHPYFPVSGQHDGDGLLQLGMLEVRGGR